MKYFLSLSFVFCLVSTSILPAHAEGPLLPAAVGELELSDQEIMEVHTGIKKFFAGLAEARDNVDFTAQTIALNGGPLSGEQLDELKTFRAELILLLTAARANPSGTGELDLERLNQTHRQIRRSTPEELYLLRERFTANVDWPEVSARLSSAARAALRPLAEHGPLSESDRAELEGFRSELSAFFAALESLSAEARSRIDLATGGSPAVSLAELPPESLFVLRERIDPAALTQKLGLPSVPHVDVSCEVDGHDACATVSAAVNTNLIDPLNSIHSSIESGINDAVDIINGINEVLSLLKGLGFVSILQSLQNEAISVVTEAMPVIGGYVQPVDAALGQSVGVLRDFVEEVKSPFITMIEAAGDPAAESQLLTQLDDFVFNRDPDNGPLGLVTCMEEVLCAEEETIQFEVTLPDGSNATKEEVLCRKGKFIPLIGEVGSDRSVFACMVIKNEVAFIKDLMPEDSLPGGKAADLVLKLFIHRLDQLCYINDWMAGNRNLLLDQIADAERNARFKRILGSCSLNGTELDCDDLPAGQSIVGLLNGVQSSVDGVQSSVDTLTDDVRDARQAILGSIAAHDQALAEHDARLIEFMSMNLQIEIENNLMESAPTFVIASFQTPELAGGYLAVVADVVLASIANALNSGLSVNFAETLFDQAEELRADEEYKRAYLMYRRAYREVVRLP